MFRDAWVIPQPGIMTSPARNGLEKTKLKHKQLLFYFLFKNTPAELFSGVFFC